MNQWPGVKLMVIEGWDEEGQHAPDSLHYEGRAVDILTSDRDKTKLGMLARLAVEAGFDWVYYESKTHIHCSVKSESSQAARYGGCFTAETTVLTSTGTRRRLAELRIGEKILALDTATKKLVFSEVILFLDYNPEQKREFLQISLASGRTLTVTPNHLVAMKDGRTVYAENLRVGSSVLVGDDLNSLKEEVIVGIKPVVRTGVFAPLTKAGSLVVNGVVASCYATIDSQSLAHWAFLPLRFAWNVKWSLQRAWMIVNKPLSGWDTEINEISVAEPPSGVHWYARALYSTASYLIPSHLHN
ncbi:hypothetical protein GWI33_007852 [Rhynchophorus ferrugineus]|uniref:Protein hedgehog n=1 Tax=Rhynchophorus ferrugineus TaxID=354439 RepID=A0A834IJH1_RHYFE|nr:hypothetical protein GWI33_007852 [Rhynchophorus ferrugineus]